MRAATPEELAVEAVAIQPVRTRIRPLEVQVAEVVVETPDTVTLVFDTGDDPVHYRAGQFCTIDPHQFPALSEWIAYLEHQKGKRELPRAYSLSSAPHEPRVAITIKQERFIPEVTRYPPLLSPLLVRQVRVGDRMTVRGFSGSYTLPDDIDEQTEHLVHVVAGSGVVPNFGMLKHSLHVGHRLRHTFIDSNKTFADICFWRELQALERRYPDRLRVVHTLTREQDPLVFGSNVRRGRVSTELFRELIPDPQRCFVYACGPALTRWDRELARQKETTPAPRFLETVTECLRELGVPPGRVKREAYG